MGTSHLLTSLWSHSFRAESLVAFLDAVFPLIVREAPCRRLEIRRVDLARSVVETIAAVEESGAHTPEPKTIPLPDTANESLGRRLRSEPSIRPTEHRRTIVMEALDPAKPSEERLLLPLLRGKDPLGVAILVLKPRHAWRRDAQSIVEPLAEPIAAALAHHNERLERSALQAAADADRESFLRRLGRDENESSIVGAGDGLRHVMERVELVASTDMPTLILGETGSGKEVIARAIHDRSSRARGPFLRVNCGAIAPDLVDSELFGHEAGSFTGATRARRGWFERADGGTLFLDEVGELPPPVQVRLLRVLQEGSLERVGGEESVHVNVRVVSATHRDLAAMVRQHTFREDLWYRLAVFQILLPPLRERLDDIAALARHFASRASRRFGLAAVALSDSDIERLRSYDWPGNVRELASVIDRAVILGQGASIEVATALGQPALSSRDARPSPTALRVAATASPRNDESFDAAARAHICRVLHDVRGRVEGPHGAAARLAVNPHTLRARMRRLGIDWASYRGAR